MAENSISITLNTEQWQKDVILATKALKTIGDATIAESARINNAFNKYQQDITKASKTEAEEEAKNLGKVLGVLFNMPEVRNQTVGKSGNSVTNTITTIDAVIKGIHGAIQGIRQMANYFKEYEQSVNGKVSQKTQNASEYLDALGTFDEKVFAGWEKLKQGDVIGAITNNIQAWHGLFTIDKRLHNEMEKNLQKQYLAEMEYNRLYRERYEWVKKIGETTLDYLQRNDEELERQISGNQTDTDSLWNNLIEKGEWKSKDYLEEKKAFGIDWLRKDKHILEWSSLAGKTWEEIERLAQLGLLSEEGMKYYEALKAAKQEGKDLAKQQKESAEELRKTYTGIASDSFADSIINGFKEGKRSAADFAETFEDLMHGALSNALELQSEDEIRKYYEEFANLSESEGELTGEEIAILKDKWNLLIAGIAEDAANMESITGGGLQTEKSRQASAKGIASASQESIDQLSGTFTAIQGHTYGLFENSKTLVANSNIILNHLSGIEGNTRYCENLADINKNIASMKSGIDDINLKGITLKN